MSFDGPSGDDLVHADTGPDERSRTFFVPTPAFPSDAPRLSPFMHRLVKPPVDDASPAAGWYSSSLELRMGLDVRELAPAEWMNATQSALSS